MSEYQNNDQICQATASLQENQDYWRGLVPPQAFLYAHSQRPRSNIPMRIFTIFGGILEIIFGVILIFCMINDFKKENNFFLVMSVAMTISGITCLLTSILRTFFCKKGYLKSIGLVLSPVINIVFTISEFMSNGKYKYSVLCILGPPSLLNILAYLGVSFQDKVLFLRFFAPFKWVKTPNN